MRNGFGPTRREAEKASVPIDGFRAGKSIGLPNEARVDLLEEG